MRLLIVDDNEIYRKALELVLKTNNNIQEVLQLTDGEEVIPFMMQNNNKIDLILMDISMKRMDGLTATYQVKKAFPKVPVLILSMHIEENYVTRAVEIGASGYLLKNIKSDNLFDAINRAINGEKVFDKNLYS